MFSISIKTISAFTSLIILTMLSVGCSSDDDSGSNDNKKGYKDGQQKDGAVSDAELTDPGDEFCVDGPSREGEPGDTLIRLRPTNDAEQDFDNLQWAVDSVTEGGTLELCDGTFLLGDGDSAPRKTVRISKGIHIVGKKDSSEWITIIQGGGDSQATDSVAAGRGQFQIANDHDSNPNIFENIWMRGWFAEAIYIDACKGFALKNSKITDPRFEGGTRMVHAIYSTGENAQGDFLVEDNLVELGNYPGDLPIDEQLLGVFFPAHDNVTIVGNTITGLDEALEVLGNNAPSSSVILIEDNSINSSFELGDTWPGKVGIMVGGNHNTSQVTIQNNQVNVKGPGVAIGVAGENFSIKNNRVTLGELDGANPISALQVGLGRGETIGIRSGPSLNNSVVENNEFSGSVDGPAINFSDVPDFPNESHDNLFKLGESVAGLDAEATIYIAPGAYNNTFEGNQGDVQDDSPEGANTY